MKRIYVWSTLLMLMVCMLNPLFLHGQGNECNRCQAVIKGGQGWLTYSNCDVTIQVQVLVANLNQGAPVVPDSLYTLPPDYPKLYLEYFINGNLGYRQVKKFNFSHYAITPSGPIPMFSRQINITINIADMCTQNPNGFYADMQFRLMRKHPTNDSFIIYPVHDYSDPEDIFSCLVFEMTCADCVSFGNACLVGNSDPVFEFNEFLSCEECNDADQRDNSIVESSQSAPRKDQLTAHPNPFDQEINISYQLREKQAVQIELLDRDGRVLYQSTIAEAPQEGQLKIPANNLATGIYYCRLQTRDGVQVVRLLKMK